MSYQIRQLSDELYLIQWETSPSPRSRVNYEFIQELTDLLNHVEHPIYFISDLRKGRISSAVALQRLAALTQHSKWAGSTAFSEDVVTSVYVGIFKRFSIKSLGTNQTWDKLEEALAFLESLKEGITTNIDWQKVLVGGDEIEV